MNETRERTAIFISHGGGPLPLMGDKAHDQLIRNLEEIADILPRPEVIVVVSAHWEASIVTVTGASNPELFYDYYGFPEESYHISYPAPGNPALSESIINVLKTSEIECSTDYRRGFDHGLFVPLKIMYPDGDIPCVQVSLVRGLHPLQHVQIGQSLAGLKEKNILLIGSGFSFHNLSAFLGKLSAPEQQLNLQFEQWLRETCCNSTMGEVEREGRLVSWESAPGARFCHPREEHLLPLHVCYGYCGTPASQSFSFEVMGRRASAYIWQGSGSGVCKVSTSG
jgi:4,5-DOPA dioxygenase extradiol